ncbi:hypothetical protein GQ53DRAFT_885113 [Thozetella sp. PMI_491]|nr:hypothetical protein GQ53DRAFT_885113 [Thozetella sp. PMI_491]
MSQDLHWGERPFALVPTPTWKADKPDVIEDITTEMVLAHNVILRGLNAIYNQAGWVQPDDVNSFLNFITVWYAIVEAHHGGEEKHFFSWVEENTGVPELMNGNREQHAAFHNGLEEFMAYTHRCLDGQETYDGTKIVSLIDVFGSVFQKHLTDEIPTLLALEKYADKLQDIRKEMDRHAGEGMEMGMGKLPIALVVHDVTWENGKWTKFPPVPWIFMFILRNVLARIHADWWKFGPCDLHGKPRPQYAAAPA